MDRGGRGDPELCLRLGFGEDRPSGGSDSDSAKACRDESRRFERKEKSQQQQQQQQQQNKQITFFFMGQICVCDITEIQARAIICMANQAIGGTAKKNDQLKHTTIDINSHYKHGQLENSCKKSQTPHGGGNIHPQLLNSGLTMKRSLQRFLQKRKARLTAAAAPYDRIKELLSSSIS